MELNDYQQKAMTTCLPTSENFSYMMLNLMGEVGEFASKVAKAIRKGYADVNYSHLEIDDEYSAASPEARAVQKVKNIFGDYSDRAIEAEERLEEKGFQRKESLELELKKEAGDILWQLAGICSVFEWNLEDIARMNLDKLASRQQRNVIDGNGDNR